MAIERALELAPHDVEVNRWALELEHPARSPRDKQLWPRMERVVGIPRLFEALAPKLLYILPANDAMSADQLKTAGLIRAKVEEIKQREDIDTQRELSLFYQQQGRTAEARAAYELWARLSPKDPMPEFWLADVFFTAKDPAERERRLRKSLDLDTNFAFGLNDLAEVIRARANAGDEEVVLAEAETLLRRAVASRSLWAEPRYNLATLLWKTGRTDEALSEFKQVMELTSIKDRRHWEALDRIESIEVYRPSAQ